MISLKNKTLIAIILSVVTFSISYSTPPKLKYASTNVLKKIDLPMTAGDWRGENVDLKLALGEGLLAYIGDIIMRKYINSKKQSVYILMMDAGNFHHPKLCFSGSGYTAEDLQDTLLKLPYTEFKASTVYFKKEKADTLSVYWMTIESQRVGWTGQKVKEFFYSLTGKKRTGIITRFDVYTPESRVNSSLVAVKDLVTALSSNMSREQAELIFGK